MEIIRMEFTVLEKFISIKRSQKIRKSGYFSLTENTARASRYRQTITSMRAIKVRKFFPVKLGIGLQSIWLNRTISM
jgi:hypothetical protein